MQPITAPILPNSEGKEVINLQEALQLLLEKNIFKVFEAPNTPTSEILSGLEKLLRKEMSKKVFGEATTGLVRIFQIQQQLGDHLRGIVEESTANRMNEILKELGAFDDTSTDTTYTVTGIVLNSNGVALENYTAEASVVTLQDTIPVGRAITNALGEFSIDYKNPLEVDPDIQVKAYKEDNADTIAFSVIKYNASPVEKLNVYLNAEKERGASEFNLIVNDLKSHIGDLKLGELKEDGETRQITYVSNKTGWDGRVTAMLAGAHQLGEALKIDPSHVYALLRAGVPASEEGIKSLATEDAKQALGDAMGKNIIPDNGNTEKTLKTLEGLSTDFLLKAKSPSSFSTMGELLDIRLNADQKNIFAQTQKQVAGDPGKLWSGLEQKGFKAETISQLQLDGKLAYLTGRNAPLVKKIYQQYDLQNDVELASNGLYKTSEWKNVIGNEVPEGITLDEYAGHLADQVKISYPTAVAAEMIRRDELNIGANAPKKEVADFLFSNDAKQGIGVTSVKSWEGFGQLSDGAQSSVKMLERMYQITPSDESMVVLSKAGLHSAYTIAKFTKSEFLAKHGEEFPNTAEAEMTYTKATEVYSTALGIATTYLTTQTMPNVYSITGKLAKEQNEIVANPTLEELLGNMDYCACDHCKSVLSPAAYLVELLQFLDLEDAPQNPIDTLKARRPDIENIQLSCENTNMALPYIDLVNEILEYYLIHGDLTDLKGHDIAEGTTQAELLAEPQFVDKTAYDELKTKVFPYNLPFHQPLEALRRLFQMWDTTLENMLGLFSTPLLSRKEALGLNGDEYKTLTDSTYKKLPEYFGEPEGDTIAQLNTAIASGKTFSRRVGISYEDLVALLGTNFINPGMALVPPFQKLHISLGDLNGFYTGAITDAQLDAMIPPEIDPDDYGGDVKQWLRDNETLIMGLITLTDIGPEAIECNFAEVALRFALPDNANNSLTPIAYHKFHRFLRLLRKTGWPIQTLDGILKALLPVPSDQITDTNLDEVFVKLLDRMANFKKVADLLSYSEKKYPDLVWIVDPAHTESLRKEQCAKVLKLSLDDMSELGLLTGIDPLADDLEADTPSLFQFIAIAQRLKQASLKIVDLAYILRHTDSTGKLDPSDEALLQHIKILRDTVNAVEKENGIAPDNADFNFAKNKMLLVYDPVTTDDFFELLLNTKVYSASLVTNEEGLPDKLTVADPNLGFDAFKKELIFTGIVSNATKNALENAADNLVLADMDTLTTQPELDTFISDFKTAVGQLFTDSDDELTSFGTNFPELKIIYDAVVAKTTPAAQTKKLVESILPELKSRLKINGLRQALIGILKSDPDTVGVLTKGRDVLKSQADGIRPVLYDFAQLEESRVLDQNKTYNFYLDVPATDEYLLYFRAPENTVVSLKIDDGTLIDNVAVGASGEIKNTAALPLNTGILHKAELSISALPATEIATILWRTKGIQKTIVPASVIYGADQVDFAKTSLIRLSKASQLQNLFKFTPAELEYFASVDTETKDFLNDLDTDGGITPADLHVLWNKVNLLIGFNLIKKENEPEENTWLQILKDPSVKNSQNKFLLEYFNLWQEADLDAVLTHYGFDRADLSKLSVLEKVWDAMAALGNINYPATDALTWITPEPSYDLVVDIKATVKQKVIEATWLETMQTVNDPVRNLLRDALVDYILQYKRPSPEITNADKLYEYFLIDVEMDACMKTSRIRQALSTVQLFVQRCLMNLEPSVDPSAIRADHWAWMKRYRVWEANRKVFLYPENWLEPELRDNKSFLFKELEGELLQSEITDESAELAFLNYLKKLDDIAKLEMVGTYLEENEKGNQYDDVLHVFGRTMGNTRQYYYRRFEGGYWTPWEKVGLNIEGDHIFPIVWRKRLFVFWLNVFEKPQEGNKSQNAKTISEQPWGNQAKKNVEINMCWGEYYKGKWTSPKSTDLKRPMIVENLSSFKANYLLVYGRKEQVENPAGKFRERLIFYIRYRGGGDHANAVFTFTSKNAPPYIEYMDDVTLYNGVRDNLYVSYFKPYEGTSEPTDLYYTQFLMPGKTFKVNVKQPFGADKAEMTENILTKKDKLTNSFAVLPAWYPVENQFEAPLSYADEHSTFFVKPDEETFIPIRIFDGYYPLYEAPIKYKDIPVLVDRPIKGWPPEEILNIGEEVMIGNPWEWNKETIQTNINYTKMIPVNDTFKFGEVEFGTAGKKISVNKNL